MNSVELIEKMGRGLKERVPRKNAKKTTKKRINIGKDAWPHVY